MSEPKKMISEIFSDFVPRLFPFGQPVLAGGAVRDTMMGKAPKDWDLFVLRGPNNWNFNDIREQIKPVLSDLSKVEPVVAWHNSEPFLVSTVSWRDIEIQVLVNPAGSIEELLATFDWNVCLFAHDGQREVALESIANIAPGKELRLQKVTFPLSTLRRGFRFSERFKMKLERDNVLRLCREIIKNADQGSHIGQKANEPDMKSLAANLLIEDKEVSNRSVEQAR